MRRLGAVLAVAHDREYHDFASLLLLEKLGPRTLQTLALVAEVVHGAPSRFSDPARFSFALGGKDGHPFPVPLKIYDSSISVLRRALDAAKLGHTEKVDGFRRLDQFVRTIEERTSPAANFPKSSRASKPSQVLSMEERCSTTADCSPFTDKIARCHCSGNESSARSRMLRRQRRYKGSASVCCGRSALNIVFTS